MLQSLEPKTLSEEQVAQMKESAVVWKQTTVPKASLHVDYTLRTKHQVGQIVHNVHKVYRVLEKSNYLKRFGGAAATTSTGETNNPQLSSLYAPLEQGCP